VVPKTDSRSANQARTLRRLLAGLRPHWRKDRDLPNRIRALLAGEKSFGSRDRRLYRELIYTAVRYLPWIEPRLDSEPDAAVAALAWLAADTRATAAFRAGLTAGWPACPPDIAGQEAELRRRFGAPGPLPSLLPEWFRSHCPAAFVSPELDTLHTRAPLWLRLQTTDPAPVLAEFAARGWTFSTSPLLPDAIRIEGDADVTKTEAYASGAVEIQDLGSQLILAAAGVTPGGHWLDACAGAGGKTLQLAALLGHAGRIDAHDIRPAALQELADRARRAGITVTSPAAPDLKSQISNLRSSTASIRITPQPKGPYDAVLLDAPCSGTGTWRRSPQLKWTTTPQSIAADAARQRDVLHRFSALVKPGGRLIYATCSLSRVENEDTIAAFLASHPDFTPAPLAGLSTPGLRPACHVLRDMPAPPSSLTILPSTCDTDGFFASAMRRQT
jgi:16S rRNA (cytosine967-C5)-methyltransferase